jgi:hypothetical protein
MPKPTPRDWEEIGRELLQATRRRPSKLSIEAAPLSPSPSPIRADTREPSNAQLKNWLSCANSAAAPGAPDEKDHYLAAPSFQVGHNHSTVLLLVYIPELIDRTRVM